MAKLQALNHTTHDTSPSPAPIAARVALVNMPWAFSDRPSIQCGLLKACLRRVGHEADVFYLNLELAAEIGHSFYHEVAHVRSDLLLGDWLFANAAFGRNGDEAAYREAYPMVDRFSQEAGVGFEELCRLRREMLPGWIGKWAEEIDWGQYRVVGFTSTFEQNGASLALARAIKQRHPEVVTVFGGSNFDGDMGKEYVRALPYIDFAVVGEGDGIFPQMVTQLAQNESPLGLPGVIAAADGGVVGDAPAPKTHDLDSLPDPDYDEYFQTLFRLGQQRALGGRAPLLLFESARGCWWGEKQHCTFCGLNNNGMAFRSKSPEATLGQLRRLSERYKILNFEAVDNIIDYSYLEKLCGPLAENNYDFRIFYETKANITPAQLRKMARAGIAAIQPGIESLNSHVLTLMRKGVTMLRNVRCIKWAYYYGMRVSWNLLTGFPGETVEDYEEQTRVLALLRHLPPPEGWSRIWLERFSPYYFDSSFPVRNVEPLDGYRFVYPEEEIDLGEIAYFFKYEMDDTVPEEHHKEMYQLMDAWKQAWERRPRPALVYQRAPNWIQIIDRRAEKMAAHAFSGTEAAVYELCGETELTVDSIRGRLAKEEGISAESGEILEMLQKFCDLGLMLSENGRYLSLALPTNPHW